MLKITISKQWKLWLMTYILFSIQYSSTYKCKYLLKAWILYSKQQNIDLKALWNSNYLELIVIYLLKCSLMHWCVCVRGGGNLWGLNKISGWFYVLCLSNMLILYHLSYSILTKEKYQSFNRMEYISFSQSNYRRVPYCFIKVFINFSDPLAVNMIYIWCI